MSWTHIVVIQQNDIEDGVSDLVHAEWITTHPSGGIKVSGSSPQNVLRKLATQLNLWDERRTAISATDETEDP